MDVQKIRVTPGELFVLGKILDAQHIDYAYIATAGNISSNYELFEKETNHILVKKGFLEEDFSGKIVVKEEIVNLFQPVFFGELETTLDICTVIEPTKIDTMKFHFYNGRITKINGVEGLLEVESITKENLKNLIDSIISQEHHSEDVSTEFDKENVAKFIVVKSSRLAESALVATYLESNGRMYKEKTNGSIAYQSIEEFREEVFQILMGVK